MQMFVIHGRQNAVIVGNHHCLFRTRNSSKRWDSERELSLRHRARTTKYNRLVNKIHHRSTRLRIGKQVYQIQWNNAMQRPLRRSRSFKVTDFGTNRKLIYDFLLVNNTNLPPILHRFQIMVHFSLAREECLTLTLSLGVIPCRYRHNWYIAKNYILWPTFLSQKVSVYLQPLLCNPPRKLPNSMKLRSR